MERRWGLIVDDAQNVRRVLAELLREMGLEAETAASGAEALAVLERHPIDLMLLDLHMAIMDGMEVLRWAREHRPYLPVVMITGHATAAAAVEAVQLGAADFIEKPFTPDELRRVVGRLLAEDAPTLGGGEERRSGRPRGLISDHQFEAAARIVRRSTQDREKDPEHHYLLGVLHDLHGDPGEARAAFERALACDLDYGPALRRLRQLTGSDNSLDRSDPLDQQDEASRSPARTTRP